MNHIYRVIWNAATATWTAVAETARGHGKTTAPHGAYTLFQMADDVAGLLDALSIEQVHFVGLSMGGMVGQVLGVRHAHRLYHSPCATPCATRPCRRTQCGMNALARSKHTA